MAYHEHSQVNLGDPEPKNQTETFAIAVPIPGSAQIITHYDDDAYDTVLETVAANKRLNDRAVEISRRATKTFGALRGLTHILRRKENRGEEANLHIHNIPRLMALPERNADIGYKVSRIQLQTFGPDQHLEAETHLTFARQELDSIEESLRESIKEMVKSEKLKKAINDCIKAGHETLALF